MNRNLEGSLAKSLFLGNILEENLFPYPSATADESETVKMVCETVEKFMSDKDELYRKYDREGYQPEEYIQSLRDLGLFGIIIPEEYGGLGFSSSAYARVLQESSKHDASTSLTIGAHSSIGMKGILLFGNDKQKKQYLPRLATGELIAAFCLTEPGAGSDAGSIRTKAEKQTDGSWILNGEKIWITNGAFAGVFTVFARTDAATNSEQHGKLTAFIVERSFPGISTGEKEDKMGIRASATTSVVFENVRVPAENVLGEEGQGFKLAMAILNNGRAGLGGGCVGGMKICLSMARKQAIERKQFGKSISEYPLVQEKIAQMTVDCFATESAVGMLSHYTDLGLKDYSVEAAMTKIFASECLWRTANEALQIAGGNGFMRHFPYERIVRDSRINMIYEGTNEILRLYVGLSGLKDVGSYLEDLKKGASKLFNDPIKGFGILSSYVSKKVTHLTSLGRDRIIAVHPDLQEFAAVFELYTVRLNQASEEVLMRLGKNIIGHQFATKRLAEIAIDLFVGLCMLSRISALLTAKGLEHCKAECEIMKIFTAQAKTRMNLNLRRLITNEDSEVKSLAKSIIESEGYSWDLF
jgi:acyl-CoA dehydrogenase family protein 9